MGTFCWVPDLGGSALLEGARWWLLIHKDFGSLVDEEVAAPCALGWTEQAVLADLLGAVFSGQKHKKEKTPAFC